MKNNDAKMKEFLIEFFNRMTKRCEIYKHKESIWLIFTDEKKWVIELTKEGTLWYNYQFFKTKMEWFNLDVVESQHYITLWVEYLIKNGLRETLRFPEKPKVNKTVHKVMGGTRPVETVVESGIKQTKKGHNIHINPVGVAIENEVKNTMTSMASFETRVENAIENGVKEILTTKENLLTYVEDTIENGVKNTFKQGAEPKKLVENIIQNGVKKTQYISSGLNSDVEDTIENGIRNTKENPFLMSTVVEDTIENGVKTKPALESHEGFMMGVPYVEKFFRKKDIEDTIENGIKEVKTDDSYRNYFKQNHKAEKVIENGIKETKTPGANGDLLSTIEWMDYNNTHSVPDLINDVIEDGVQHTYCRSTNWFSSDRDKTVQEIIKTGVTKTEAAMRFDDGEEVEHVIENGVKNVKKLEHDRTTYHAHFSQEHGTHIPLDMVQDVIENGVKETIKLDDDRTTYRALYNTRDCTVTQMNKVQDVIESGITNTLFNRYMDEHNDTEEVINEGVRHTEIGWSQDNSIDDVIKSGIVETKGGVHFFEDTVENVIEQGIKIWGNEYFIKFTEEPIINNVRPMFKYIVNPIDFEPKITEENRYKEVDDVIKDGVKEIQPLPAQDGNKDWGMYYVRQEDRTKPHTEYVKDVIRDGVKETHEDVYPHTARVEGVIKNGVKHTHSWDNDILGDPPRFENILKDIEKKN